MTDSADASSNQFYSLLGTQAATEFCKLCVAINPSIQQLINRSYEDDGGPEKERK